MNHWIISKTISTKDNIIRIQNHFISSRSNQKTIIHKRLFRIEVKYEYQIFASISQYLVTIIVPDLLNRSSLEILHALDNLQHFSIKVSHIVISQILVIYQIPLTASVLTRPSVSFTRKINPFGMSEFITHKVPITSINRWGGQQTDHFM